MVSLLPYHIFQLAHFVQILSEFYDNWVYLNSPFFTDFSPKLSRITKEVKGSSRWIFVTVRIRVHDRLDTIAFGLHTGPSLVLVVVTTRCLSTFWADFLLLLYSSKMLSTAKECSMEGILWSLAGNKNKRRKCRRRCDQRWKIVGQTFSLIDFLINPSTKNQKYWYLYFKASWTLQFIVYYANEPTPRLRLKNQKYFETSSILWWINYHIHTKKTEGDLLA